MKNPVDAGRLLAGLVILAALAGCTVTKPLPAGFYKPAANGPAVLPIKVAVITEGFPATTFRGDGAVSIGQVKLDTYPNEAAVMLREIYRTVTVVPTAAEAADSDMLVYLGNDYPRTLLMTFRDTRSGTLLSAPQVPGLSDVNTRKPGMGSAISLNVLALATLGIAQVTMMAVASKLATQYVADIQADSNLSLHVLRDFIRTRDELMLTPADRVALKEIHTQAAAALAGGDALGALLSYQQALAKVIPGGPLALDLQAKAVAAAVRMGELPPVPAEAQNLMARGKAALALARSPAEYSPASLALERALALAPWWGAGHYNAALTQEGGGQWGSAAAHLQMLLQLDPQSPERDSIRQKVAELELRQERGDKPVGAK